MKATKAQVEARIGDLLRIRLDGAELWDVKEFILEKISAADPVDPTWGREMLTDSQIYRYLQKVEKAIAESCRGGRKRLIRNHLAVRRNLFAKAVLAGDYRTALTIKKDEAELLGLYPPTKIAPTSPDGKDAYDAGGFSDPEVLAILQGLASRLGIVDAGPGGQEHEDAVG